MDTYKMNDQKELQRKDLRRKFRNFLIGMLILAGLVILLFNT